MRLTGWFLLFALTAPAQTIGENKSSTAAPATFQVTSQLVMETVVVKDKNGNPVEGLTAKDFTVTEDGATQAIRFFEFQKLPDDPAPLGDPASPKLL